MAVILLLFVKMLGFVSVPRQLGTEGTEETFGPLELQCVMSAPALSLLDYLL